MLMNFSIKKFKNNKFSQAVSAQKPCLLRSTGGFRPKGIGKVSKNFDNWQSRPREVGETCPESFRVKLAFCYCL